MNLKCRSRVPAILIGGLLLFGLFQSSPAGGEYPSSTPEFAAAMEAYNRGDYLAAFTKFQELAEQGDKVALNNLGLMYENGQGVNQDQQKAALLYYLSAQKGFAPAQCNLGVMYESGRGVSKDIAKACQCYLLSAQNGNLRGQYNTGVCYSQGWGFSQDHAAAVYWFGQAADGGHAKAQSNFGLKYLKGQGVLEDHVLAYKWLYLANQNGCRDNSGLLTMLGLSLDNAQKSQALRLITEYYAHSLPKGD